ncbi:MAG: hypothetical protein Q9217_002112 [Psora testacea]
MLPLRVKSDDDSAPLSSLDNVPTIPPRQIHQGSVLSSSATRPLRTPKSRKVSSESTSNNANTQSEPPPSNGEERLCSPHEIEAESTISEREGYLQHPNNAGTENQSSSRDGGATVSQDGPFGIPENESGHRPQKRSRVLTRALMAEASSHHLDDRGQRSEEVEAIDMLARLLDLTYFDSAKSDLDKVGLLVQQMKRRDAEQDSTYTSEKAGAASPRREFPTSPFVDVANGQSKDETNSLQPPEGRLRRASAPQLGKPIFDVPNISEGFQKSDKRRSIRKFEAYDKALARHQSTASFIEAALTKQLTISEYNETLAAHVYIYWTTGPFGHVKIGKSLDPIKRLKE